MWTGNQFFAGQELLGIVTPAPMLPDRWRAEYRGRALGISDSEQGARRKVEMEHQIQMIRGSRSDR